jgi:hypothetical protein
MNGKDDADLFDLHITNIMISSMGAAAVANVFTEFVTVDGKDVCRVHVKPSGHPVESSITIEKKGQPEKKTSFFMRLNGQSREADTDEQKQLYVAQRWGGE